MVRTGKKDKSDERLNEVKEMELGRLELEFRFSFDRITFVCCYERQEALTHTKSRSFLFVIQFILSSKFISSSKFLFLSYIPTSLIADNFVTT